MVGVIAIAAIVVFGSFGNVIEEQTANAANLLSGDGTVAAPAQVSQTSANDMILN